MADFFRGHIIIGGTCNPLVAEQLFRALQEDQGGERIDELPALCAEGWTTDDHRHLDYENEQAFNGCFGQLEDVCQAFGLAYIRRSEGFCEIEPEVVYWAPGMPLPDRYVLGADGEPMLPLRMLNHLRMLLEKARYKQAKAYLDTMLVVLPDENKLPPFVVVKETEA